MIPLIHQWFPGLGRSKLVMKFTHSQGASSDFSAPAQQSRGQSCGRFAAPRARLSLMTLGNAGLYLIYISSIPRWPMVLVYWPTFTPFLWPSFVGIHVPAPWIIWDRISIEPNKRPYFKKIGGNWEIGVISSYLWWRKCWITHLFKDVHWISTTGGWCKSSEAANCVGDI